MLNDKNPVHDPRCNSARETPLKYRHPRRNKNLSFATKSKKTDAPEKKQTNKSHARFLIHVSIIRRVCHKSIALVFSIGYSPSPPVLEIRRVKFQSEFLYSQIHSNPTIDPFPISLSLSLSLLWTSVFFLFLGVKFCHNAKDKLGL